MKKSKLFIGLGALVLAIGGVFATKANKNFVTFVGAFDGTLSPISGSTFNLPTTTFTTTVTAGLTIVIATVGANHVLATLKTTTGSSPHKKVYFN
jgi:hypothetical protein